MADLVDFLENGHDPSGATLNSNYLSIGQTEYESGGSIGKAMLLEQVVGHDPTDVGPEHLDLATALAGTVCRKAITNVCAAAGNYRNTPSVFGQSLGIIAQVRGGQSATKPVAYLVSQQQADGSFPSQLPKSAGDEDVDSTAMAAMALDLVPGHTAVVDKALAWMAGRQLADGGFPARPATPPTAPASPSRTEPAGEHVRRRDRPRPRLPRRPPAAGRRVPRQRGDDVVRRPRVRAGARRVHRGVLRHPADHRHAAGGRLDPAAEHPARQHPARQHPPAGTPPAPSGTRPPGSTSGSSGSSVSSGSSGPAGSSSGAGGSLSTSGTGVGGSSRGGGVVDSGSGSSSASSSSTTTPAPTSTSPGSATPSTTSTSSTVAGSGSTTPPVRDLAASPTSGPLSKVNPLWWVVFALVLVFGVALALTLRRRPAGAHEGGAHR